MLKLIVDSPIIENERVGMAGKGTRTAAFASYGITLRNRSWSLSGRSEDEQTVAVSVWDKDVRGESDKKFFDRSNWGDWYSGPGRRFLFEDLAWARDHCGGIVRIVLAARKECDTDRVQASKSHAAINLIMRVTHLDPKIGAFRLEQVDKLPEK